MYPSIVVIGSFESNYPRNELFKNPDNVLIVDGKSGIEDLANAINSGISTYVGLIIGGSLWQNQEDVPKIFPLNNEQTIDKIRTLRIAKWAMENWSNKIRRILYMPRENLRSPTPFNDRPKNFSVIPQNIDWITYNRGSKPNTLHADDIMTWKKEIITPEFDLVATVQKFEEFVSGNPEIRASSRE